VALTGIARGAKMDEGPKTLVPENEEFLNIGEVLSRLRKEFRHVVVDSVRGSTEIDETINWLQNRKQNSINADEFFDAQIEELSAIRRECVFVTLADREDYLWDYLATVLKPEKPIFFGFSSAEHEAAGLPMVERCARALGYEIE
jgi:hypothetical protein